jgi:hypothetical protein
VLYHHYLLRRRQAPIGAQAPGLGAYRRLSATYFSRLEESGVPRNAFFSSDSQRIETLLPQKTRIQP